ncbi:hypothetical protein SDC9_180890 [bioreactor metagenome]|uniref:Uncharacterized protein n=1 Tax=bioreactor metagenome TaxID=1076179 RepID=A0A645HC83_9ZZZZ
MLLHIFDGRANFAGGHRNRRRIAEKLQQAVGLPAVFPGGLQPAFSSQRLEMSEQFGQAHLVDFFQNILVA